MSSSSKKSMGRCEDALFNYLVLISSKRKNKTLQKNPTSQSPTNSPRQTLPRALKRKKLLESGLKIEARNEKRGGEWRGN
jgi:hypothetical protein